MTKKKLTHRNVKNLQMKVKENDVLSLLFIYFYLCV